MNLNTKKSFSKIFSFFLGFLLAVGNFSIPISVFAEEPVLPLEPLITSFSPNENLIPGESMITLYGQGFGDSWQEGIKICFDSAETKCINDSNAVGFLAVGGWSDTEVMFLMVPGIQESDYIYFTVFSEVLGDFVTIQTPDVFTLAGGVAAEDDSEDLPTEDPEIISIEPVNLISGETVITITGNNFGNSYTPGENEICFDNLCILDHYVNEYLISWSNTEIQIKTPEFLTNKNGSIFLRLYSPTYFSYMYFESPGYTTILKPLVDTYYPTMLTKNSYIYTGLNFGPSTGEVLINNLSAEILSWSDVSVNFIVPENAVSGQIMIKNTDGVSSSPLNVTIIEDISLSDDTYSYHQWYLENINADDAWNITEGSVNVVVAVIDTGVDPDHEDLKDNIWENNEEIPDNGIDDDDNGFVDDVNGWDFFKNSNIIEDRGNHGTGVASLIAAKKDNKKGIAGVAPNVKIMPLNISLDNGYGISIDAANQAIKYAVDNGADVINMSFGGTYNEYYDELLQYAYDNNVFVVVSTGNEGEDLNLFPKSPVCNDLDKNVVIGVTAVDEDNKKSDFSNFGSPCADLSAPGESIALALEDDGYGLGSGTSFSAPLVAGAAALIKSKNPSWNVEEIEYVLLNNTQNIDSNNFSYSSGQLGKGLLDVYAALTAQKPSVTYTYTPRTDVEIEETNIVIQLEEPNEPELITDTADDPDQGIEQDGQNGSPVEVGLSAFSDTEGYKFEDAIIYIKLNNIVQGYPDGTYKPDAPINRAEFTKILMNAFMKTGSGSFCFPDVNDEWYANYVCGAKNFEIIQGYPDGTFKPDQNVNFVEALKIVLETSGKSLTYNEGDEWFTPYLTFARENGLFETLDYLENGDYITRGEMAYIIYWILEEM